MTPLFRAYRPGNKSQDKRMPPSFLSRVGAVAVLIALGVAGYSQARPAFTLLSAANAASHENAAPAAGSGAAVVEPLSIPVAARGKTADAAPVLRWGDGILQKTQSRHPAAAKPKRPAVLSKQASIPAAPVVPDIKTAWQAYQAGHYDLARERYEQVIDGDNNVGVQLGLAAIAMRQNRGEYAVRHYQRALVLDPHNATALAALAMWDDAYHAGDIEAQIKQMLDQQPSAALQFSLGNLYAGQRRWREAEAAYFESYQADSRNADYAYNLAVSLDYLRLYPAALTYYLKARDLATAGDGHGDALRLNKRIQQLQDIVSSSR